MKGQPTRVFYCESNTDGTVGGSFYSLFYLVESLDRTRFEPVVAFYFDNPIAAQLKASGIETHVLLSDSRIRLAIRQQRFIRRNPLLDAPLSLLQAALNLLHFWFVSIPRRIAFLRRHRIGLVHLNNSILRSHSWMIAASLLRLPCVTHERGINVAYPWMARMLGRRLSAVICISYAVRDTMLRLGVDPDNLHVIHNGLASERVAAERPADAVRAEAAMGNGRPVIGMVGNIKEWKGQHVVVQALPAIRARFPEVICLLVGDTAAADRPFDERLRGMIRDLGVGDTVRFTGYQRNVADYVALFDVAIHASTDPEPFGRVLLEAMALSKPLVAARAGAVPEIVVDGETGFSFTPGDSGDLAARVIWLLEHPDEAERLGNAGLRRLKDEFHVSTNARRTQELYARALQPGEASA